MQDNTHSDIRPREGGPYSLFCYTCHRWIPNTANSEMRKEGVFAHGHLCVKEPGGQVRILFEKGIPEEGRPG